MLDQQDHLSLVPDSTTVDDYLEAWAEEFVEDQVLLDKFIQIHTLLSEATDVLAKKPECVRLLSVTRAIEQLSDYLMITFQNLKTCEKANPF